MVDKKRVQAGRAYLVSGTTLERIDRERQLTPPSKSAESAPVYIFGRNTTAADWGQYSVASIVEPFPLPVDNLDAFKEQSVDWRCTTPTDPCKFVVFQEPATAEGEFVRIIADGETRVRIDVTNDDHKYAVAEVGTVTNLVSDPLQGHEIVWREGGTGEQWAVIHLDTNYSRPFFVSAINTVPPATVVNSKVVPGMASALLVEPDSAGELCATSQSVDVANYCDTLIGNRLARGIARCGQLLAVYDCGEPPVQVTASTAVNTDKIQVGPGGQANDPFPGGNLVWVFGERYGTATTTPVRSFSVGGLETLNFALRYAQIGSPGTVAAAHIAFNAGGPITNSWEVTRQGSSNAILNVDHNFQIEAILPAPGYDPNAVETLVPLASKTFALGTIAAMPASGYAPPDLDVKTLVDAFITNYNPVSDPMQILFRPKNWPAWNVDPLGGPDQGWLAKMNSLNPTLFID